MAIRRQQWAGQASRYREVEEKTEKKWSFLCFCPGPYMKAEGFVLISWRRLQGYQGPRLCLTPRFLTRCSLGLWSWCPSKNILGRGRKWRWDPARTPSPHYLAHLGDNPTRIPSLTTQLIVETGTCYCQQPLSDSISSHPLLDWDNKHGRIPALLKNIDYPSV